MTDLKAEILNYAKEIDIDLIGITSPDPFPRYLQQLEERAHLYEGRYAYRFQGWRDFATPKNMMKDAKSLIVIGYNYLPDEVEQNHKKEGKVGRIVSYGHLGIIKRVRLMTEYLESKGYKAIPGAHRKEAAVRAGLGMVGKHALVINPKYGSWVAYQTIITDAELAIDEPFTEDICGSCTQCLDACPTNALYEPHKLNPGKCVTCLLTSEEVDVENWTKLNSYILGCDICQEACPKNRTGHPRKNIENLLPDWMGMYPPIKRLLKLTEKEFNEDIIAFIAGKVSSNFIVKFVSSYKLTRKVFGPIKKLASFFMGTEAAETLPETFIHASGKMTIYQRNAIIAAGMSENSEYLEDLERFTEDEYLKKYAKWSIDKINKAS